MAPPRLRGDMFRGVSPDDESKRSGPTRRGRWIDIGGRPIERFVVLMLFLAVIVAIRWVWLAAGGEPTTFNDFGGVFALISVGIAFAAYAAAARSLGRPFGAGRATAVIWFCMLLVAGGVGWYL